MSDEHEPTPEQLAHAKPFAESFPDLAASIKRGRGRPRVGEPLEDVTPRLPPRVVQRFKDRVTTGAAGWLKRWSAQSHKGKESRLSVLAWEAGSRLTA